MSVSYTHLDVYKRQTYNYGLVFDMLNEYKIRHLNINDTEDMYSCIMRSYASMKNKRCV